MKLISLLPADTYTVINKTIITEEDRINIISLYEPLIGPIALALYFTLLHDVRLNEYISSDFTHHHIMNIMNINIDIFRKNREILEGVGLIKTYLKEGEPNSYVYEIYSPLSAKEFFSSPIFNISLYNNIGKYEYNLLKEEYQLPSLELKGYQDVSACLNLNFSSTSTVAPIETQKTRTQKIKLQSNIDFNLLMTSMPKGLIKANSLTKKLKDLIEQLSFIYNIDTLQMIELLRTCITEQGTFDAGELRQKARKYYQYSNDGKLPTLIHKSQPECLKTCEQDSSPLSQKIFMFETTSPYEYLKIKNKGGSPTSRDLKLIEDIMVDLELPPAVVNVLIDYVLKKNNNKLSKALVETIAGQWKRCDIKTAKEAIELAKKENAKSTQTKTKTTTKKVTPAEKPEWFDKKIEKEEMNQEELNEMEELLKDFR